MFDALNALFACPQNNLRVFQSGNLIYGDHANSISCEQLQTQLFPGEIMALIKHLLVACLLREYSKEEEEQQQQQKTANESRSHVAAAGAAFGKSTFKRCGMKTKPTETIEIGRAKHVEKQLDQQQDAPKEPCIVDFVKAVAGQPQRRTAAETASPRYTKRTKMATATQTQTTTTTTTTTTMSANVATRIEMETESETETTSTALAALNPRPQLVSAPLAPSPMPCETEARISKAEIFHLPKNCVLQKILHLQLLVKRHFHYMWAHGYAQHGTPSYGALRALLGSCQQDNVQELPAEQAYMLGATALDCSIMLTFQEVQCQVRHHSALQPWLITLQGRHFLTKLSILDLDPKPDSHFHKYIKQTRQIKKACVAFN
ncbi:inositol-pentakisphosphate 2-kinase isoform X2 [Drosophila hydei]|nr:inositol-pentakisphosphate 2-kinase isoform X2 [Drosophila hydei]